MNAVFLAGFCVFAPVADIAVPLSRMLIAIDVIVTF